MMSGANECPITELVHEVKIRRVAHAYMSIVIVLENCVSEGQDKHYFIFHFPCIRELATTMWVLSLLDTSIHTTVY